MVIKELVRMFSVFDENNLPETIFHRKVILEEFRCAMESPLLMETLLS